MATKRKSGLIHCDNCGEYYSASYRRCPFCDEYDDEYEASDDYSDSPSQRSGGGKRLAQSNRRGGGYTRTSPLKVISIIISLAVILFAAWIVVTKIMPLVQRGNIDPPNPRCQPGGRPVPRRLPRRLRPRPRNQRYSHRPDGRHPRGRPHSCCQ